MNAVYYRIENSTSIFFENCKCYSLNVTNKTLIMLAWNVIQLLVKCIKNIGRITENLLQINIIQTNREILDYWREKIKLIST